MKGESITVKELVEESHETAVAKGWWDDLDPKSELEPHRVLAQLALIVSEIAGEAVEDVRNGEMAIKYDSDGKPYGFPIEIADAVIRIGDLCGRMGIDLQEAVIAKMDYNHTRERRHGGKRA